MHPGISTTWFLLLSALLACNQPTTGIDQVDEKPGLPVLAYYVPEKDYQPDKLLLHKLTHIIFSFSKVVEGEMNFENEGSPEKLRLLVDQKKNHPNLKVMIACGGWGAGGFSDMASTDQSRQKFVQSAIKFLEEYQLDGLDVDWEYPGMAGPGIDHREEDKQTFTLLMKELREGMDSLDRPQTLTFASAGWERYYDHIELNEVMKYVDFMNVMTYDQIGATTPFTGHHTALGFITDGDIKPHPAYKYIESRRQRMAERGLTFQPRSAERIIEYCLDQGVNSQQIVIGAAFYGRAWKGVMPENNGLYQPNGGSYIGWVGYSRIRKEFENHGYQRHWDPVAKAPFLYNPKDSIFVSYDDTVSVKLKTQYAIDNKLGGIMFWQLGNDTKEEGSLLDAIYSTSSKTVK